METWPICIAPRRLIVSCASMSKEYGTSGFDDLLKPIWSGTITLYPAADRSSIGPAQ